MVKVLVCAVIVGLVAWAVAADAHSDHARATLEQADQNLDRVLANPGQGEGVPDPPTTPLIAQSPLLSAFAAFIASLVVGCIILIAVNSERRP